MMRRAPVWPVLLAGAAVAPALWAYWPALDAGFVGDDFMILHRLRDLEGVAAAGRFFRGEFFEYYRPLGFLSHALDWRAAGADPRWFHRTNLLLHALNCLLVFLIARALARPASPVDLHPRTDRAPAFPLPLVAGLLAAWLFGLHASNHEAVVWISARFDLLATFWALAAVWCLVAGGAPARWLAPVLFGAAVLSKESAVALPIAAAASAVFLTRSSTPGTIRSLAPWLIVLAAYAAARQIAGGVPAAGGRLPKLLALLAVLALLVAAAGGRWRRLRDAMLGTTAAGWPVPVAIAGTAIVVALAGKAGLLPELVTEKLAVAGFALVYLALPVTDVPAGPGYGLAFEAFYQRAAIVGLPALGLLVWAFRRRLFADDRAWFLALLFVAALLPISALTEGRRYLYLPSAVVSVAIALAVVELRRGWRAAGLAAIAGLAGLSALRVHAKTDDWIWAGRMTADGAALVDSTLAPACNAGDVVFLTSPVAVRGVYSHFYYETFESPRGCMPATFHVVARVLKVDARVEAAWAAPGEIVLTVPDYRGNFVFSEDLRRFDVPLLRGESRVLATPVGQVTAEAAGSALRISVRLGPEVRGRAFFYYSGARIRPLPPPPDLR